MSNNNVPTAPGEYWYRRRRSSQSFYIVSVDDGLGGLMYYETASERPERVYDDGLWAGPVPMPGEWVPRSEYDEIVRNLDDRI